MINDRAKNSSTHCPSEQKLPKCCGHTELENSHGRGTRSYWINYDQAFDSLLYRQSKAQSQTLTVNTSIIRMIVFIQKENRRSLKILQVTLWAPTFHTAFKEWHAGSSVVHWVPGFGNSSRANTEWEQPLKGDIKGVLMPLPLGKKT